MNEKRGVPGGATGDSSSDGSEGGRAASDGAGGGFAASDAAEGGHAPSEAGGGGRVEPALRPLKVHRVIARLNVGGPAMHVVNLTRDLAALPDFETTLIAGRVGAVEGDMDYYARERGVEPLRVPSLGREPGPFADVRALITLVRIFRRDRPDIVHTHTAKAGTLGRLAARIAGVPVVVHTFHGHVLGGHYFSPLVTRAYRFVERQVARLSDRLIVLTKGQVSELAGLGVADRTRFQVIPLGLELGYLRDRARNPAALAGMRARVGTPKGASVIGVVGRLVPIKNHDLLLEALAKLVHGSNPESARPPVELWVVGAGEREDALRAQADRLGVGDRIRWLGWRTDLADLYPSMDVVALASHDEGTPVALLESIAAGTPVVATEVGGVGEVLRQLGLEEGLVPPSRPDLMAEALRRALERGTEGGRGIPDQTRDAVVRGWATERLANDMARLYRELSGRPALHERTDT